MLPLSLPLIEAEGIRTLARNSSIEISMLPSGLSPILFLRRTILEKCKPQALQSVLAPPGPLLHSGVSSTPQERQLPGAGALDLLRYLFARFRSDADSATVVAKSLFNEDIEGDVFVAVVVDMVAAPFASYELDL